jgi:hypothetical protein
VFIACAMGDGTLDIDEANFLSRVMLADRMKWTLDYIDTLDVTEYQQLLVVLNSVDRATQYRNERRGG